LNKTNKLTVIGSTVKQLNVKIVTYQLLMTKQIRELKVIIDEIHQLMFNSLSILINGFMPAYLLK